MCAKTSLTAEGYQKLVTELNDLKIKQNHLVTQIEEVAQPDEAGEDALATQLKEELEVVNDKIADIEEALENPEIITGKRQVSGGAQIGHRVTIKIANTTKEICLVSHLEADPTQNKISDQSPLGQAIIGKAIGDTFEFEAPVGRLSYKIVSIS